MPMEGVYCAAPQYAKDKQKQPIAWDDCLACASTRDNPCNWTLELLTSLRKEQQDRGDHISATTLVTKCLRSEFLARRLPWYDHPKSLWAAFRGTMYHWQLERVATGQNIAEPRYYATLEGLGELSGSPDLIDIENGILYDYKTNKENPHYGYPWGEHGRQCNINRWLVDHAHTVEHEGQKYALEVESPVYSGPKQYADIEANRKRFRPESWNQLTLIYMDDKGPKPLNVTKSVDVPKADGKGTKKARVADIWSDEAAEDFIRKQYAHVQLTFESGNVPDITEDFQGWEHPLCNYCPVRSVCIDLQYGGEVPVVLSEKRPREKF